MATTRPRGSNEDGSSRRQPAQHRVAGVRHRYVHVDGLRMHVAEAGPADAPPVVLLHGWPQHWYCWRKVIPLLARERRVVCPDLRGFGWTDAPEGAYAKEQLAADVLGLMAELGLEDVELVGHDWGGVVGFLACLHDPGRIRSFLAMNTGHPWPQPGLRSAAQSWRVWPYQSLLATPVLGPRFAASALAGVIDWGLRRHGTWSDEAAQSYRAQLEDPRRRAASSQLYRTFLLRELPAWGRGRYHDARLEVPTLMLHGGSDPALHPDLVRGVAVPQPLLTMETIERAGHFMPEQLPELVAERLLG